MKKTNRCYYESKERLAALTNKDDHKDKYEKIFEELAKEKLGEIKEIIDEIIYDDLTYYFTGNTT